MAPQTLRPDEQPLAEYRSVSRMAVLAAVLGVVSAVALTTPLLAPVPLAAIVIAAIALRSIAVSNDQLTGRAAATFGLCLATLFLGWSLARHFGRQAEIERQSRLVVDAWFNLVCNGKLREALQFRHPPASRIAAPQALVEHYEKDPEAVRELQQFASQTLVKELLSQGDRADIRFEAMVQADREGFSDRLILRYSYHKPDGNRQPVWAHLYRRSDETTQGTDWELLTADINPPPNRPTE